MRIDLNHGPQPSLGTDQHSAESTVAASSFSASSVPAGEDQAGLSGTQVQALVARAAQLPEVRQERVHALRQTIESGLYHPGSERVAGAMFEHMIAVPGV